MKLHIGDTIRVGRSTQWAEFDHYGIYVGRRGPNGEDVIENNKNSGMRLNHLADFANGQQVYVASRTAQTRYEQETIVRRAWDLLGKPYNLVSFNCEHAANYAQFGSPISSQVQRALVITGIAAVVTLMIWSK